MPKIKGCPLCDSEPNIDKYYQYDGYMGESPTYKIYCPSCHIKIEGSNPQQIIDKWNTESKRSLYYHP